MRRSTDTRFLFGIVVATGVASVSTQIAALREFLTLFSGNELTVSIFFFSWLSAGALGTLAAAWIRARSLQQGKTILILISSLIGVLGVLQIIGARIIFSTLFLKGTSQGFYAAFGFITGTNFLYCGLIGFILAFTFQLIQHQDPGARGAHIYLADNCGDALGAMVFTFILIRFLSPVQGVAAAALILLAATLAYCCKAGTHPALVATPIIAAVLTLGLLTAEIPSLVTPGGTIEKYLETEYGRVMVTRKNGEHTLVLDGKPLFSTNNTAMAEESVHYPLAQLKTAGKILVISGQAGIFEEIEKYNPKRIDYLELDPGVSDALLAYGFLKKIKGLTVIHDDAIRFLNTHENLYNAVLVTLGDPETFQANRLFTSRFFRLVKSRLEPGGILSFSLEGLAADLPRQQILKFSILKSTLETAFSRVLVIPGESTVFIASDMPLSLDIPGLLEAGNIPTRFVADFFSGMVNPLRMDQLNQELVPSKTINQDLRPALVTLAVQQWFDIHGTSITGFALCISSLFFIVFTCSGPLERVLFTTGASMMGMENLVILAYQIAFGNIYEKVGLVVAMFLLGLIPGTLAGLAIHRRCPAKKAHILAADLLLAGFILLLLGIIPMPGTALKEALFLSWSFLFSAVCAYQVPVVFMLKGESRQTISKVFTSDLMGASLAPLLFTLVMVPLFGIFWTIISLSLLKLMSAGLLQVRYD